MKQFIIKTMYQVFNDFKKDLDLLGKFCSIKQFRFDSSNIPNYNNILIQRYYLLRYLPAYLVEYYLMYKEMFEKNFINKDLNILSIGVGCGIDLWGLKFILDDINIKNTIIYTGLDRVKWNYWNSLGVNQCRFLYRDIGLMNRLDKFDYNVIVFSKSIGEFDDFTFRKLKNIIKNSIFINDKIILLSSIRKSRNFIDIERLVKIGEILEDNHNYKCLDEKYEFKFFYKKENGHYERLENICPHFTYPKEILDFMITLNEKCQGYLENLFEPCDDNCRIMNRRPILTTSQIEYQILRFIKKKELF